MALFLGISCLMVIYALSEDVLGGGSAWKQGDWLINSEGGRIRRSLSGDLILMLSDTTDLSALLVTACLQLLLVLGLYLVFFRLLLRVGEAHVALTLLLSPALFVSFWMGDTEGSLRKELIAFLALGLLVMSIPNRAKGLPVISSALIVFAFFAHEATTLFAPVFLFILHRADFRERPHLKQGMMIAVALGAAAALTYGVFLEPKNSSEVICASLTQRGLNAGLCGGAIRWLDYDLAFGVQSSLNTLKSTNALESLAIYIVSLLPFAYLAKQTDRPRYLASLIVLSGLPFLPLYVVAVDWGRWMSWHVLSVTYLFMTLMFTKEAKFLRAVRGPVLIGLGTIPLLVTPRHTSGAIEGGILNEVIGVITSIATSFLSV